RLEQLEQRAADGRLAAARFTHQAERLAASNGERHAVDRIDLPRHPAEEATMDGEVLLQSLDFEQRRHAPAPTAAPAITLSACQQAIQWPGRRSSSGGDTARH